MTENQALILDLVVGFILTVGSFLAAGLLGVDDTVQGVIGMTCMAITCALIGVIDVHYTRKEIERGEPPDDLI
jgi:hypothetical protein